MCGIVGIIHADRDRTVDEHLLRSMTDVMQYRGPDDSGIWLGEGVGLGHRRLSVIDLAGGHQPMTTGDLGLWITYNGEIYNYLELPRGTQVGWIYIPHGLGHGGPVEYVPARRQRVLRPT